MTLHPPRMRRYVPPTDEEAAKAVEDSERQRAEEQAAWEADRPARRAAILAGPGLSDVDAAVECRCTCHPHPADMSRHDGGESCHCQGPDPAFAALLEVINEPGRESTGELLSMRERTQAVAAEAEALGVEASVVLGAAPFVIVGVCDGRGFFLRERGGHYRVTIAPDEAAGSDPWTAGSAEPAIDIASGYESDLVHEGRFSSVVALRVAVDAVRTALARNFCDHRLVESEPYCPSCGVRREEAEAWRW